MKIFSVILVIIIAGIIALLYWPLSQEHIENRIESTLEIDIPEKFDIISQENSSAPGDYFESYELKFNVKDYDKLINTLKSKYTIKQINSGYTITKELGNNTSIVLHFGIKDNHISYSYAED
jgi:hypothetical protein